ncbi:MAG: HDOD domain-containing protein [Candidatus Hydrogenedens sp.]
MEDILKKLEMSEDLPTLPVVMTKLIDAINDENSSAEDLTKIMENDPAISARVLKLANSAFYGLRFKVDNLKRAIVVLGFETVRMLALSTTILDLFTTKKQLAIDPKDFWLHSLGAGKSAQILATKIKTDIVPETLFSAGLLHDIGKYCLALALKEEYKTVVKKGKDNQVPLYKEEKENLSLTYYDVNSWLAQKWNLPETLYAPMTNHNQPENLTNKYPIETYIIHLSSEISRVENFGMAGDFNKVNIKLLTNIFPQIRENIIKETREEIKGYISDAKKFLSEFENK